MIHVAIKDLTFAYSARPLFEELSLSLRPGEIVTLLGSSGSGKTTLLKLLSGVLPDPSDSIRIGDAPPHAAQRQIAFMMQEDVLLPWLSVRDNVQIASRLGTSSSFCSRPMEKLFADLSLEHCMDSFPDTLSVGMRQRAALARTLYQERPLLLLDEPFAALDVVLREQLYALIRQTQEHHQTTILLVTHDFRDALTLSDRILLLAQGSIIREWTVSQEERERAKVLNPKEHEMRETLLNCSLFSP